MGLLLIFGIIGGEPIGFKNFSIGDAPFHNGILGLLGVLVVAGFSFGGTEVVAVTAGESENPQESMPKAIKQVFWRILLFYIGSIFIIACIIPYTDPRLLNQNSDVAMSPFTIIFEKVGILFAASVMNTIILTAVLSAGNSGLYATSRLLFSLSQDGKAPRFLGNLNKNKMPFNALLVTTTFIIIILIYANINMGGYGKLLNMVGSLILIVWAISIISHIRLRQAIKAQGKSVNQLLPFKAPLYPVGPIIVLITIAFLMIGQSFADIQAMNWVKVFESFLPLMVALAVYFSYKVIRKVNVIPAQKINLDEHQL